MMMTSKMMTTMMAVLLGACLMVNAGSISQLNPQEIINMQWACNDTNQM
jgi:hypothetical protein